MKELVVPAVSLTCSALIVAAIALAGRSVAVEKAKAQQSCHPSYAGVCLDPTFSDYDCNGTGDGPGFTGMVRVVGPDVYDLDDDQDGIGCDGIPPLLLEPTGPSTQPTTPSTQPAAPTSQVEAEVQTPSVPVAGFGPLASSGQGPTSLGWAMAALAGAGAAWLVAGLAGGAVNTVHSARTQRPQSDTRRPATYVPRLGRRGAGNATLPTHRPRPK